MRKVITIAGNHSRPVFVTSRCMSAVGQRVKARFITHYEDHPKKREKWQRQSSYSIPVLTRYQPGKAYEDSTRYTSRRGYAVRVPQATRYQPEPAGSHHVCHHVVSTRSFMASVRSVRVPQSVSHAHREPPNSSGWDCTSPGMR